MKVTINPKISEFYKVEQDELAITANSNELRTGGLSTCTALIVTGGGRQLLAHIDSKSNDYLLEKAIKENFDPHDPSFKAIVVTGDGSFGFNELSEAVVYKALNNLDMDYSIDRWTYTDSFKELVVRNGKHYQDNKKIPSEEIIVREGKRYVFYTNTESAEDLGAGRIKISSGTVCEDSIIGPVLNGIDGYNFGVYRQEKISPQPNASNTKDTRFDEKTRKMIQQLLAAQPPQN